ncbi:MAG TPA: sigma 54-interacting transcriptional regulator [Acidimicrobiales bacterium]|nr:sigma 54-interacting transcriptional regulator [Acidimicrobiales bacterium]
MPRRSDDGVSTVAARRPLDHALAPAATYRLTVVEGPDRGRTLTIDGAEPGRVLVGQSPACALQLSDRQVSRRHLALLLIERRLRITDLGSTNGSQLNDVAVLDAYVRPGDLLRLGETTIHVELVAPSTTVSTSNAKSFGRLIGQSPEMRQLYPLCERLAAIDVPLVIEGETGTGKEVLAESLHECGPRASAPLVVFDCTAVPPSLVESDLFGHERGAFTGAVGTRKGVFEQADGGTLLIDEIGDLDLALQPKLLRAIERSEVRRVGGDRPIRVNVRLLCATRRDLDREVQAGRFRDDLFHRLAVTRIELPPLRRRRGDVPVLAQHFASELGGDKRALSGDVLLRWEEYAWPGNVRELRNTVARHLALRELGALENRARPSTDAPPSTTVADGSSGGAMERVLAADLPFSAARQRVIEEFEQLFVERVLARNGGNVARSAEAAGIGRRYLQRLRARKG